MELLDRIDRAMNGECPCGAQPREGSAYCSDDCTPTHISDDTDTRMSGDYATAMRWRPDLVTEVNDSELTEIPRRPGDRNGYTGQFNPSLYERNANTWHLRLDDGNRFVGVDVEIGHDRPGVLDLDTTARIFEAWAKLERELTDSRRLDPGGDPWADAMAAEWNAIHQSWLHGQFGIAEPEADRDALPVLARATCALRHLTAAVPQLRPELDAQEHPIT